MIDNLQKSQENTNTPDQSEYVDVISIFREVWKKRITVIKFLLVGVFFGIAFALLGQKEYRSIATLMPEYETGSEGGVNSLLNQYGGLIGLRGGTYASNSNAIRVTLYPNIVNSTSFLSQLMYQPIYFSDIDSTVTIYEYYEEHHHPGPLSFVLGYTIGLPKKLLQPIIRLLLPTDDKIIDTSMNNIRNDVLQLTKEEAEMIEALRKKIGASLDEETGIIGVSVTLPDPQAAANVADFAIKLLTDYLIDYRVGKELIDLEFIEKQLEEATLRFENVQEELASFREQYRGNLSVRSQTEEQRLESEYQVAFGLYNTLMQQREQAKLKVQEQTPVFKILEPVQVPHNDEKSGFTILFVFTFLSGLLSLFHILYTKKIINIRNKITK